MESLPADTTAPVPVPSPQFIQSHNLGIDFFLSPMILCTSPSILLLRPEVSFDHRFSSDLRAVNTFLVAAASYFGHRRLLFGQGLSAGASSLVFEDCAASCCRSSSTSHLHPPSVGSSARDPTRCSYGVATVLLDRKPPLSSLLDQKPPPPLERSEAARSVSEPVLSGSDPICSVSGSPPSVRLDSDLLSSLCFFYLF
jgi:hypothetical protein